MRKDPPALLFIHGFGGAAGWWERQKAHFGRSRQVIAADLPGHGGSPWNGEGLEEMADKVRAMLDGPAAVMASSFGGLVALKLWERSPQLMQALVFVGSVPRFTACDGFPAGLDPERIRKLARQLGESVPSVLEMFFRSLFTRQERESVSYADVKRLRQGMPVPPGEALDAMLDILEATDLRAVLSSVDVPVGFIFGDGDPICPVALAGPLRSLCPAARIEVMKGCGHFPFLSRPDEFNRIAEGLLL